MTLLSIVLSIITAVVYSVARKDVGAAFGIASFLLGVFGFFVAVVSVGEWVGLESPSSFSNTETWAGERLEGQILWDES